MKNIGFIGLGIMGKPMAKNLLKSGYPLVVYNRSKDSVKELVAAGAKEANSPKEVAQSSEVVITMLPNSPEVREVVLGSNGVLEGAATGMILVDMSSIDPQVSKEIAQKVAESGIIMLDAPVSGGEPKAINGTLSIMVGGPEGAFQEVKEILAAMGSSVVRIGDIGSGNVTKLANQIIVALNIAAMSEAMVFATKAGVKPSKVYEAIRGGLAGSTVLDAKMPMVLDRNFKPGFKIELHIKDLMNAMDTARDINAPIALASQVLDMMQALKADGKGIEDHSGLIQYYENLAQIKVFGERNESFDIG
jgi:2-hydroxy-3-oxopropionate reductase